MNSTTKTKKIVGYITVSSGVVSLICLVLFITGLDFNFYPFSEPVVILDYPGINIQVLHWGIVADLIGFYLLIVPAIFYLQEWMRPKTFWYNLLTFSGFTYVILGALGAAILASVLTPIIFEYKSTSSSQQDVLRTNFRIISNIVYNGIWNSLEVIFGGIWWLGSGTLLHRSEKHLGEITIALGMFTLLDGLGSIIGIKLIAELGLAAYLILAPIWAIWLGIVLIHK